MSALAAVRCNPVIPAFYLHLRAAGKPARWAVRGFTEALQADLANTGIGVTLYESGVVQSEYWDHNPGSRERVPKMGTLVPTLTAEAAGRAIVRGITREQKLVVVPFMMKLTYWQHAMQRLTDASTARDPTPTPR